MPFPVDASYIKDTEKYFNVKFPNKFKSKMMLNNGGELFDNIYYFELYPFFDKSSNKRISRTCNHIQKETKSLQEAAIGFPNNSIAIGSDEYGNQLLLMHTGNGNLGETLYLWNLRTKEIKIIVNDIDAIKKEQPKQ